MQLDRESVPGPFLTRHGVLPVPLRALRPSGSADVELLVEDVNASTLKGALRLRNRDVGHAFPTYVARVLVDPDYHYRGVFTSLLETLQDLEERRLRGSDRRISTSSYVLAEMRRPLGAGG